MDVSEYLMRQWGYHHHSPPMPITCTFFAVKIYSIKGILFEADSLPRIGKLHNNVSFGIGNKVNAICIELLGDIFFEDEDKSLLEKKAVGPFLVTLTEANGPVTHDCTWTQEKDGRIETYNAFKDEKRKLESICAQWEVPGVLSLGAVLTKPDRLVKMKRVRLLAGLTLSD
jgi:hypothetical protein